MDIVFGLLFVSTFLSKVIQIGSLEIMVGTFRVLRKHPQLRYCAARQRHVAVGARISDQTGVCEGLPYSWARNKIIENGYGYARKVHQRINYEPPIEGNPVQLNISGVLNEGAKIDVHFTWTNMQDLAKGFYMGISERDKFRKILISCYNRCDVKEISWISVDQLKEDNLDVYFPRPHEMDTADGAKISYVAQGNTLNVLVNDKVVVSVVNQKIVRVNYIESVGFKTHSTWEKNFPKPGIRMMEFTEA